MIQGGYVSPSSAKTLTVNKKSNVLNKIPPRGPKGSATNNSNSTNNNNNNNNSTISASSIDVSMGAYVLVQRKMCQWMDLSKVVKSFCDSSIFLLMINHLMNVMLNWCVRYFTGEPIEGIDGWAEKAERRNAQIEGHHRETRESNP